MTFVSATASQGTGCTFDGRTVKCNLGSLTNGASATVTIVVSATQLGMFVNQPSVAANERDSDPTNNRYLFRTMVNRP